MLPDELRGFVILSKAKDPLLYFPGWTNVLSKPRLVGTGFNLSSTLGTTSKN